MTKPPAGSAEELLERAAETLRREPDGWSRVRPRLLTAVGRALQPSTPVRGRHELGEFVLAGSVVVSAVRGALDRVAGVSARGVRCLTSGDRLDALAVDVAVTFGTVVPAAADQVRAASAAVVADLLGPRPGTQPVRVDVHVVDVVDAAGPRT